MEYDKGYNLTKLQSHDTLTYRYDNAGRVVKKHNKSKNKETHYTYSPSGILLQAGEQHYSSNNTGNLTHNDQHYNSLNQLIEDADYLYAYDKRGNLKEKLHKQTQTRSTYVFNLFDQLEKVKTVDKNQNLIEGFKYSYDALNRRVSKTSYTQKTLPYGTTHYYVYDEENIVAILDHNKQLLATIIHDTKTDTPLSITTMNNSPRELSPAEKSSYSTLSEEEQAFLNKRRTQRTYYYHRDHQGSITALTDEEGKIVESFLYDEAYGTILDHYKTEATLNPYCYTGREFDSHDLYYYRARYYDPTIGRFISSDPIEFLAGDFNFYRYVGNDPVNWVDPSGYFAYSTSSAADKIAFGVCDPKNEAAAKVMDKKVEAVLQPVAEAAGLVWDVAGPGKLKSAGDAIIDALGDESPVPLPGKKKGHSTKCDQKEKANKKDGESVEDDKKKKENPECAKNRLVKKRAEKAMVLKNKNGIKPDVTKLSEKIDKFDKIPKENQVRMGGKANLNLDCKDVRRALDNSKAYKKIRKKMDRDVKSGKCPASTKPNSKKSHDDQINNSNARIKNLEKISKHLNC